MGVNELLLRPEWFISIESWFFIISVLITLAISFYAYKVYKITNNKRYKYMAIGFFAMGVGFLLQLFTSFIVIEYNRLILYEIFKYVKLNYFYTGGLILYAFFVLSCYVILACLASKVSNKRVIISLLLIALLSALLIRQARSFTFFYFFSFVLLVVYIVPHMYDNYNTKKSKNSFLVFLSFLLLTMANLVFLGMSSYRAFDLYILGHFISLLAYIILLISFILVLKK